MDQNKNTVLFNSGFLGPDQHAVWSTNYLNLDQFAYRKWVKIHVDRCRSLRESLKFSLIRQHCKKTSFFHCQNLTPCSLPLHTEGLPCPAWQSSFTLIQWLEDGNNWNGLSPPGPSMKDDRSPTGLYRPPSSGPNMHCTYKNPSDRSNPVCQQIKIQNRTPLPSNSISKNPHGFFWSQWLIQDGIQKHENVLQEDLRECWDMLMLFFKIKLTIYTGQQNY